MTNIIQRIEDQALGTLGNGSLKMILDLQGKDQRKRADGDKAEPSRWAREIEGGKMINATLGGKKRSASEWDVRKRKGEEGRVWEKKE